MENSFSLDSTRTKLSTKRICLFDADFIKYVITSRKFKSIKNNEELSIEQLCKDWYDEVIRQNFDDYVVFCFSGKSDNTFREHCAIDKKYKGNRQSIEENYQGEKNDQYSVISFFQKNHLTLLFPDLEADDILSALQDKNNTYIYSQDKDLVQVPGWHYSFSSNSIYEISTVQAVYNLCYQLIRGDSVDNIGGIKGYGDVKTVKYLEQYKDTPGRYINSVLYLYQLEFGQLKGTDAFVEAWNLVKLRSDRGEHFKNKYVKMFDLKEYLINRIKTDVK